MLMGTIRSAVNVTSPSTSLQAFVNTFLYRMYPTKQDVQLVMVVLDIYIGVLFCIFSGGLQGLMHEAQDTVCLRMAVGGLCKIEEVMVIGSRPNRLLPLVM
jgi:hypothetical protein